MFPTSTSASGSETTRPTSIRCRCFRRGLPPYLRRRPRRRPHLLPRLRLRRPSRRSGRRLQSPIRRRPRRSPHRHRRRHLRRRTSYRRLRRPRRSASIPRPETCSSPRRTPSGRNAATGRHRRGGLPWTNRRHATSSARMTHLMLASRPSARLRWAAPGPRAAGLRLRPGSRRLSIGRMRSRLGAHPSVRRFTTRPRRLTPRQIRSERTRPTAVRLGA